MSIQSVALKTALLIGLLLTGIVLDPAQALSDEVEGSTPYDENSSAENDEDAFDFDALPEEEEFSDGFEDLIYEPFEEEPGQPENIALMVETSDNVFTQEIYFPAASAELTLPAQLIIAELASALELQEQGRVTVVARSRQISQLDAARITSISAAFGDQGVPGSWVQLSRPITLAAAY
ncbi:MAG: hypothetical protein EP347_07260 [Alphaproteobacteria bacterium]|nr:MAG: hypothetical protein EP347_07260 [Alphaproteobacteria bacterium]